MVTIFNPRHPVTVTLLRREVTGVDDLGNDVYSDVEAPVPGSATYPRHSDEFTDRRDLVVVGITWLAPAGTVVRPIDRAVVHGRTWEVDGEPGVHYSTITGHTGPVEVALKAASG